MAEKKIITIDKIKDEKDLDFVVSLEIANFTAANRANRQTIVKRFKRYPGCVLLKENGVVIGYNSYGPIDPRFIHSFGQHPDLILPVHSIVSRGKSSGDEYFASISTAINRKNRSGKVFIADRPVSYYGLLKAYFFHEGKENGFRKFSVLCESNATVRFFKELNFSVAHETVINGIPANLLVSDLNNPDIREMIEWYRKFRSTGELKPGIVFK